MSFFKKALGALVELEDEQPSQPAAVARPSLPTGTNVSAYESFDATYSSQRR